MPVTTVDGLLEAWADGIETMEQNLEAIYGPPGITPTLPAITTEDGMLEAIAEETEKAVWNVAKDNNVYYDVAAQVYTNTVPAGVIEYKTAKIGGRTVIYNQQVTEDLTTWATNRCTVINEEGVYVATCSSTAYNFWSVYYSGAGYKSGHKYYYSCDFKTETSVTAKTVEMTGSATMSVDNGNWQHYRKLITKSASGNNIANITIRYNNIADVTVGDKLYLKNAFCIDLTQMFGSGNEPSTLAECQAILPGKYYAHNTGELLSAGVTQMVSRDGDNNIIDTLTIPADVQALTGYGLSAGSAYNYIDFANKKFVQNVGAVNIGNLTFGYGPSVGWSADLTNAKNPADDDAVFNGISENYTAVSRNTQATAFAGGSDAGMISVSGGKVYVGTGDIGIVPSGVLYYELDTPVETDISEYLTNTDIDVEAGGSLTFPNQHGDDYCIPVPVETEYIAI